MLAEIGHFCLVLALMLAIAQSIAQFIGPGSGDSRFTQVTSSAAIGQALLLIIALAALVASHALSDFSVRNVVENQGSSVLPIYKVLAGWNNYEALLLLAVTIIAAFGSAVAILGGRFFERVRDRMLHIQGIGMTALIAVVIIGFNPFLRVLPLS